MNQTRREFLASAIGAAIVGPVVKPTPAIDAALVAKWEKVGMNEPIKSLYPGEPVPEPMPFLRHPWPEGAGYCTANEIREKLLGLPPVKANFPCS